VSRRKAAGGAPPARLLVAAVGAVAALSLVPVAEATFPGRNGRLATSYGFDCGWPVIATMRSDGTATRRLTPCRGWDQREREAFRPDWSPDGRRLLFTRTGYLNPGRIAVMNADGSRQRDIVLTALQPIPLTNFNEVTLVSDPSFSPDGKRFVYTRSYSPSIGDNIRVEIWVAALDGSEDRMLRRGSGPLWSPDGLRIVYSEPPELSGNTAVKDGGTWLMRPETGDRTRRIARRSLRVLDWSPSARRLLYLPSYSTCCTTIPELHVMRADGTRRRRLTSRPNLRVHDAAFSPDGRRIAFSGTRYLSGEEQQDGIWIMSTRSRRPRRIFAGATTTDEDRLMSPPSLSWQAVTRR
jgi:Tol biopolymer transport system component